MVPQPAHLWHTSVHDECAVASNIGNTIRLVQISFGIILFYKYLCSFQYGVCLLLLHCCCASFGLGTLKAIYAQLTCYHLPLCVSLSYHLSFQIHSKSSRPPISPMIWHNQEQAKAECYLTMEEVRYGAYLFSLSFERIVSLTPFSMFLFTRFQKKNCYELTGWGIELFLVWFELTWECPTISGGCKILACL